MSNIFLKILTETEKIMKFKYFVIMMIIIGIAGVLMIIKIPFKMQASKNEFQNLELKTKVINIKDYPRDRYFLLDSTWYNIKSDMIDNIELGDSIIKNKGSLTLLIKNSKTNQIKYSGEPRIIIIKEVENPSPR